MITVFSMKIMQVMTMTKIMRTILCFFISYIFNFVQDSYITAKVMILVG